MPGSHDPPVRILVGDEEPLVCTLVKEALGPPGFQVEVCHDEADLLRRCRERAFSLLIVDFALACGSGFRGIIALRERDAGVPIILMASGARARSRVDPLAFTYRVQLLRKPFGVRNLRDAVERAIPGEGY